MELFNMIHVTLLLFMAKCGNAASLNKRLDSDDVIRDICLQGFQRLPGQVSLPGSSNYSKERSDYWSLTSVQQTPYCFVTPNSADDVVIALQAVGQYNTTFALRGGGHNPAAGGSSLSNGVVIAADRLNSMVLDASADPPVVRVGAGVRFNQVYDYLAKYDLTATGGRYYDIGVGGFTVGGGMTYFRSVHGWSADTVVNFEVALPDGLVSANATSNTDLFWALKGGSGNFGYVTRYDFKVFPLTKVFGGNLLTDAAGVDAVVNETAAYSDSITGGMNDPLSAVNPTVQLDLGTRQWSTFTNVFYNKSVAHPPASIKAFTEISSTTSTISGPRDFVGFFNETATFGSNDRRGFRATSLKSSPAAIHLSYSIFKDLASKLKKIDGSQVYVTFQPMSQDFVDATHAAGDAISLDPANGPFIAVLYAATWNTTSDDAYIGEYLETAIDTLNSNATTQGLDYPFIFLNDAGAGQNPFPSYGAGKSLPKLRQIASKYDHTALFQRLGHNTFKL